MVNILQENKINFKSLEKNIFKYGCEVACEELKNMLQEIDRWLMKTRDKAIYRHKGHRKTCIKTLMGEVEYSRAIYEVMDGSSERKFVYLLDEYMGFDCVGFVSSNLAEKIADNICECSYAQTAKNITELTGQSISHQGVWNVIQKLGKKVEEQENRYIELNKNINFHGDRETKVLMEEADGVIVRKQKRCKGKGKNFEIKLALFHEGWKQTGKDRYELAEKNVVCGIESSKEFAKRKEAMIAKIYNTDEIEMRIFNSDGGSWIRTLYENNDSICHQLDLFHVNKAIKGVGIGKDFEYTVFNYLKTMQIDEMLTYMETVMNSIEEDEEIAKVLELYRYLSNNRDSLIPYQNRGIELPELNEGLVYRRMGNAEHNVYLTVAKRMKHRSAAWSEKGSLNLCKIVCLKVSHKLSETLETISNIVLPENFRERVTDILSAGRVPKKVGKGYLGKICSMPYSNASMTDSRRSLIKWLKGTETMNF